MMKKNIFMFLVFALGITNLYSQVGINTDSPKGVLHIKNSPTSENNGILVTSDENDGIILSIESDNNHPSASINLGSTNKAFKPNSVKLVDSRGASAGNPIKNPTDGMVVYNTNSAGSVPYNVVPGLYTYNASEGLWMNCISESSINTKFQNFILASPLSLPTVSSFSDIENYGVLSLQQEGSFTPTNYIEVKSEAAYILSVNLSGSVLGTPSSYYKRMGIYVAAVLLNDDGSKTLLDIAEINPAAYNGNNRKVTYPLILGFNAKQGSRISLLVSSYTGPSWTLLQNETSVVFWKI